MVKKLFKESVLLNFRHKVICCLKTIKNQTIGTDLSGAANQLTCGKKGWIDENYHHPRPPMQ